MDAAGTVVDDGVLYARDGVITAIQPAAAAAPPGFEQVAPVDTGGTVYPGLIELHNHLPYDVLRCGRCRGCSRTGTSGPVRRPRRITG